MKKHRMTGEERSKSILAAAVTIYLDPKNCKLTRSHIAKRAKCSPALVSAHLGDMNSIRRAVVKAANQ